jgi:hypothetical protein
MLDPGRYLTRRQRPILYSTTLMHEPTRADTPMPDVPAGHAELLRLYFSFQAYGGLIACCLVPVAIFLGHAGAWRSAWIYILLLPLNTWAAFQTRRLLREEDRAGGWMAAGTFACNLLTANSVGHLGWGAAISVVGLLLTANVYRHLR